MTKRQKIKAFKAMNINDDGTYSCRGFKYEIGKPYTYKGEIELCGSGFHACKNPADVYQYYPFGENTEVFEVEIPASATIIEGEDKLVANKIKIIGPVADKTFNIGVSNTGYGNTGNKNTGDQNTGDQNTGDQNTGDQNTGYKNTGYKNTGDQNTGYRNTGDQNTGNWNSANYQTGFFNTIEQPVSLFNGAVFLPRAEALNHPGMQALYSAPFNITKWVPYSQLTKTQKAHTAENSDGMTVSVPFKEACADWWEAMSPNNRALVQTIPGFDSTIFEEITGIDVTKQEGAL